MTPLAQDVDSQLSDREGILPVWISLRMPQQEATMHSIFPACPLTP